MIKIRNAYLILIAIISFSSITTLSMLYNTAYSLFEVEDFRKAPLIADENNVYVVWWSNQSGNDEVMFRASADRGITFGDKINLSNTLQSDSQDVSIAASENKVYVTWWERNNTSDEPVMRISNDSGTTFGPLLRLSQNGALGDSNN